MEEVKVILTNIAGQGIEIRKKNGSTLQLAPREEVTLSEKEINGNSPIKQYLKENYIRIVPQKVVKSATKHTKKKELKGTKS
jgi:hypothetical protein